MPGAATVTQPAAGPPDILEDNCRTQGCCWDPLETRDPHIDLADCFYANNGRSDYQLVHSVSQGMLPHCSASNAGGYAVHCVVCTASGKELQALQRLQRPHVVKECACPQHVMPLQLCMGFQISTGSPSCQHHHLKNTLIMPQADACGQKHLHITASSISAHAMQISTSRASCSRLYIAA